VPRYSYPHTIENGAGEQLTFARRVAGGNGVRVEGYNVVSPGAGPPMHLHHLQDEQFTVRQGRLGYRRLGEAERFAGPGESVLFRAGEAHRFWNAGQDELRCDAYVEPADNIEYFLTEMFASARRNGGRPSLFDIAFLSTRYRSEYEMLEVPAAVQRILFPLVVTIGRLLGKYGRYADAPEPVR
jgi:uncharacterized cupin superfamily protein